MFEKIKLFWKAFQIGEEVASPEKWKSGAITGNKIVLLLTALIGIANAYGITIDMDTQTISEIGVGIFAIANYVIHLVTSKKVGLAITTLVGAQQAAGSLRQASSVAAAPEELPPVDSSVIAEAEQALAADRGR